MRKLFRLLAVLVCCSIWQATAAELGPTFEGLDGKQHPLSQYLGQSKWTIVGIWAPRCRYCHQEMPERERLHRSRSADINVIGIAVDFPTMGYAKPDEVRAFVRRHRLSYPILLADGGVAAMLGGGELIGTPTTLLFNPRGELVARQPGRVSNKVIEDYIAKSSADTTGRVHESK